VKKIQAEAFHSWLLKSAGGILDINNDNLELRPSFSQNIETLQEFIAIYLDIEETIADITHEFLNEVQTEQVDVVERAPL